MLLEVLEVLLQVLEVVLEVLEVVLGVHVLQQKIPYIKAALYKHLKSTLRRGFGLGGPVTS